MMCRSSCGFSMPIRPENKSRYPKDWPIISIRIRERAGWKCEQILEGRRCNAEQGKAHPITGSKVILTVAHLDHQPENCRDENLKAMCQRCHNTYDGPMRRLGIQERAKAKRAMGDLFE